MGGTFWQRLPLPLLQLFWWLNKLFFLPFQKQTPLPCSSGAVPLPIVISGVPAKVCTVRSSFCSSSSAMSQGGFGLHVFLLGFLSR